MGNFNCRQAVSIIVVAQEIRENITEEGLERVARLSALAADPAVRRRVEVEANEAVAPAIAAADTELIPICLRLVEAVRAQFEASAAAFDLKPLSEFIGEGDLDGVTQYVTERLDATRRALDALASKAHQNGSLAHNSRQEAGALTPARRGGFFAPGKERKP